MILQVNTYTWAQLRSYRKKIYVAWSGGIDGTYVAARLLAGTQAQVHLHHIHFLNRAGRAEAEARAVDALVHPLERIRGFSYSESTVAHPHYEGTPWDMVQVCVEAGNGRKDSALRAEREEGFSSVSRWTIGTHDGEGHWQTRWDVLAPIVVGAAWPFDPPEFFLPPLATKAQEIAYLKRRGLFKYCWYCRQPVDGRTCGGCPTCLEVRHALGELKTSTTTTQPRRRR